MDQDAYRQYDAESTNWLRRGRMVLLDHLLDEAAESGSVSSLLEIGAGVGQNIPVLARRGSVDVTEIDELGLSRLRTLTGIGHIYTDPIPFELGRDYDVICAMDVIEHLEDDAGAVKWIVEGLRPGGHLVASVPAYQWLFGDHDVALGHYRRYTRSSFAELLRPHFDVVRIGYFNSTLFPAVAARRVIGRVRGPKRDGADPRKESSNVPEPVDRVLERMLRVEAAIFERRAVVPFGLSVFALARRRD